MLSFKQFIYEAKKIDLPPEELKTAYELRRKGTNYRDLGNIMGYSDKSLNRHLDHPDTIQRAKENNIEYHPQASTKTRQKPNMPERMVRQAYELRGRGITDTEMHKDSDYGFSKHFKDTRMFTKHLEDNKEKFPDHYTPSPRKKEKRSADFEPTIYKKSLSGMSHRDIAGEHGISSGNVRAIVSRQHKKAQGKPMEKDINENWVKTRQAVRNRVIEMRKKKDASISADSKQQHLDDVRKTVVHAMNTLHGISNNTDYHSDAREKADLSLRALRKHFQDHY